MDAAQHRRARPLPLIPVSRRGRVRVMRTIYRSADLPLCGEGTTVECSNGNERRMRARMCCTPRGGPRIRCCSASPTGTRGGDRARAAEDRGWALQRARCRGIGDCRTQGASTHGDQTGFFKPTGTRIIQSPVNAGPGRGEHSTLRAKCQGRPAGLGAAGSGELRAAGRVRALPCRAPAGRRLAGPAGAVQRHGWARLGRPRRLPRPRGTGPCEASTQLRPTWAGSACSHLAAATARGAGFGSLP
jgi:hypothetical protein